MRILLTAALLALSTAPVIAQMPVPGRPDPKAVPAGAYKVEPNHTQVRFGVLHMGFNPYYGTFSNASGTLQLDPAHAGMAKLSVSVPVASVATTSAKLDEELKSADWLDAGKYPTMTFTSTNVAASGTAATISGTLTLHGVSKPITLQASFVGAGKNPMGGTQTVGFTAKGIINRSDFGVTKYVPLVSDQVTIEITAAFEKQG
jgi:polyisoprenoid-binding protein YceI